MLKEYVCTHCSGTGKWWHESGEGEEDQMVCDPCPFCAAKNLPPRVVLPFDGPPATSERIVEISPYICDDYESCRAARKHVPPCHCARTVDEQVVLTPTGTTTP